MSNQNDDNNPPSPSTQNIYVKPNTEGHAKTVIAAGIVHGGVGNTYNFKLNVHVSGDSKTGACQHAGGEAEQREALRDMTETPTATGTQAGQGSVPRKRVTQKDADPAVDLVFAACYGGDVERVKRFLNRGRVDVNCRENQLSSTLVMWAAKRGHRDLVEILVRRGADLSLVDVLGNNILHYACEGGDMRTVEFLLSVMNLVDINARNNDGQKAAYKARDKGHHQLFDFLESLGAE